ncbi:peptidoglycan-binding protein [Streptomyces sp. NPDC058371]|uniref:peptidoglycan-binding domain-containing protein n=1 Tax=Streptomyces sp. NPDC058371 TaxID=3346463 RepID=UPI003657A058
MSIPPRPARRPERPALEPTDVQPRPRPDSLAELLRRVREKETGTADVPVDDDPVDHDPVDYEPVGHAPVHYEPVDYDPVGHAPEDYEPVDYDPVMPSPVVDHSMGEDPIVQVPPAASPASRRARWRYLVDGAGPSRAATAMAVAAAALLGFTAARLLPDDGPGRAAQAQAPVTPPAPPASAVPAPPRTGDDPDGPGTLRVGDSGAAVTELQQRLLRIPDVYTNGATNGTYDAALTAAVTRFQVWYDIRGDETGVYGNDTRTRLESLTAAVGG